MPTVTAHRRDIAMQGRSPVSGDILESGPLPSEAVMWGMDARSQAPQSYICALEQYLEEFRIKTGV